jgi:hypothetical protein
MQRLAHSIPPLMVVAVAIRAAYLLGLPLVNSWFDTIATTGVLIAVIALVFHLRFGGLCLRCIQNAPDDPQTEIQQKRFFLWQVHWSRRRFWITYFVCWLCTMFSALAHGVFGTLLKLPLDVLFFSLMWATWCHHRLQPWCPWCRGWGEGGEPEVVPDPDPAETKRA